MEEVEHSRRFVILGHGPASFIFREGDAIAINYERDAIPGRVVLKTRYLNAGFDAPLPGDLSVEVTGGAATAEEAATWITVGRELASILSLATNAAASDIEGEVVYEVTPGVTERDFFQRFVPGERVTYTSRTGPVEAALAFMSAVATNEHRDRLLRAITQYTRALQLWGLGNELLVVSHLWMGVEAIKKAALREHIKAKGISDEELGLEWGFKPDGGYQKLAPFLDAQARSRLVYQGDDLHHRIAREVSDSFEHGLANGGALFAKARDTLVPTARHLRRSILDISGVAAEHRELLLAKPYDTPRGLGGFELYYRTKLVGDGDQLAADGFDHPFCDWKSDLEAVELDREAWRYSYTPKNSITARIGPGMQLVGHSFEVWDGGTFTPISAGEALAKRTDEPNEPPTK